MIAIIFKSPWYTQMPYGWNGYVLSASAWFSQCSHLTCHVTVWTRPGGWLSDGYSCDTHSHPTVHGVHWPGAGHSDQDWFIRSLLCCWLWSRQLSVSGPPGKISQNHANTTTASYRCSNNNGITAVVLLLLTCYQQTFKTIVKRDLIKPNCWWYLHYDEVLWLEKETVWGERCVRSGRPPVQWSWWRHSPDHSFHKEDWPSTICSDCLSLHTQHNTTQTGDAKIWQQQLKFET